MNRRLVPLAVAVVCLTTACTNGPGDTSPTLATTSTTAAPASTTTTTRAEDATAAFRSCLDQNGVEIEPVPFDARGRPRLDLVMRGVDFSDPDSVEALTTCSQHLSAGALELSGEPLLQESVNALLVGFTECIRSHGVPEFPDPIPGYNGIGAPYPVAEIPYTDPALPAAVELCRSRLDAGSG